MNRLTTPAFCYLIIVFPLLLTLPSCSEVTSISGEQLEGIVAEQEQIHNGIINEENQPLWVINGEIISNAPIRRMKPTYIDSVVVLKEKAALDAYGERGRNGVVQIFADKRILKDLKPDSTGKAQ